MALSKNPEHALLLILKAEEVIKDQQKALCIKKGCKSIDGYPIFGDPDGPLSRERIKVLATFKDFKPYFDDSEFMLNLEACFVD